MANIVYAVPTLEDVTLLTNPSQILSYQLLKFVTFPKSASMTHYDNVHSLADILSNHKNTTNSIVEEIEKALVDTFSVIFNNNYTVSVDVQVKQVEENVMKNSTVKISISLTHIKTNELYTVDKAYLIDHDLTITTIDK